MDSFDPHIPPSASEVIIKPLSEENDVEFSPGWEQNFEITSTTVSTDEGSYDFQEGIPFAYMTSDQSFEEIGSCSELSLTNIIPFDPENVADDVSLKHDIFCWVCHKEISIDSEDSYHCCECTRSYHVKCIKTKLHCDKFLCEECVQVSVKKREISKSPFGDLEKEESKSILKSMIYLWTEKLEQENVDINLLLTLDKSEYSSNSLQKVISNAENGIYTYPEEIKSDIKWLLHRSAAQGDKTAKRAYTILLNKVLKQQLKLIHSCPSCFEFSSNIGKYGDNWFVQACKKPHPLAWVRLKGFPLWPAKILFVDKSALCYFFGGYELQKVNVSDCWALSSSYPEKKVTQKQKNLLHKALKELYSHIDILKELYGKFQFYPENTLFDPCLHMKISYHLPSVKEVQLDEIEFCDTPLSCQETLNIPLPEMKDIPITHVTNSIQINKCLENGLDENEIKVNKILIEDSHITSNKSENENNIMNVLEDNIIMNSSLQTDKDNQLFSPFEDISDKYNYITLSPQNEDNIDVLESKLANNSPLQTDEDNQLDNHVDVPNKYYTVDVTNKKKILKHPKNRAKRKIPIRRNVSKPKSLLKLPTFESNDKTIAGNEDNGSIVKRAKRSKPNDILKQSHSVMPSNIEPPIPDSQERNTSWWQPNLLVARSEPLEKCISAASSFILDNYEVTPVISFKVTPKKQ